jgi:soluble lytic murein transglycosylase-like protein
MSQDHLIPSQPGYRRRTRGSTIALLALAVLSLGLLTAPALRFAAAQDAVPQSPSPAPAPPPGTPEAVPDAPKSTAPVPGGADAKPAANIKPDAAAAARPSTSEAICLLVESAAQAHGLPFEFFARLIWQESRFQPNAVGPMTRRGQRAEGIAQFMPGTANERGLFDPFDPVSALPKSAEFLEELHATFGNLGLAAAAYNAGPRRVRDWLDGRGGLPAETRNYVLKITGRSAEEWAAASRNSGGDKGPVPRTSCRELMALLHTEPSPFISELERRVAQGGGRPWGVELSAGFSRERVLGIYSMLEKTYRALLENRDPLIIEGRLRSRGTGNFYQVRVGADTRQGAMELCTALHNAGAACLVLRNSHGKVQPLQGTPARQAQQPG